ERAIGVVPLGFRPFSTVFILSVLLFSNFTSSLVSSQSWGGYFLVCPNTRNASCRLSTNRRLSNRLLISFFAISIFAPVCQWPYILCESSKRNSMRVRGSFFSGFFCAKAQKE